MTLPRFNPVPPQPSGQRDLPSAFLESASTLLSLPFVKRDRLQATQNTYPITVPSTADFVIVLAHLRGTAAAQRVDVCWQLNGDQGANYSYDQLFQVDGTPGANNSSVATASPQIADIPAATADSGQFGWCLMAFVDLQSTVAFKRGVGWSSNVNVFNAHSVIAMRDGYWNGAPAGRSILLFCTAGSFAAGSLFKVLAV